MRKLAAFVGILMASGLGVMAQQDNPIRQRQALMKNNQEQVRSLTAMARGQAQFDAPVVQTALRTIEQSARQIPPLFPPNSFQGETRALPVIAERKADFDAHAVKLEQDARAAQTRVKDQASLQAELQVVGQNCNNCHQTYRKQTQ